MYDDGYLTDGVMIEWLKSHTNVVYQPPVGHKAYSGINPYALGFAMYTDIKRICEEPDRRGPRSGSPTSPARPGCRRSTTRCATTRTRASSASSCRPKLMRELRLFAIVDDEKQEELEVVGDPRRQPATGACARSLARQYDLGSREPNIQVWNVNLRGDRSLTLRHFQHNDRPLHDTRAGGAQARGAAVGLRRAAGKRQRRGRRQQALEPARSGGLSAGLSGPSTAR